MDRPLHRADHRDQVRRQRDDQRGPAAGLRRGHRLPAPLWRTAGGRARRRAADLGDAQAPRHPLGVPRRIPGHHAGDDGGHLLGAVFPHGQIVQEKQRLRAAADDIVDAHGHAVDAHGVVLVHQKGQLQLGAHTVGAGHQHRIAHAGEVGRKQAAEAADAPHHAGGHGAPDVALHQLHGPIAGGDVHPGGLVAFTVA
ncbi:hypothetical protein SDC9_71796 [bioreactor metagenome]|uniref:Uncharacterized protein n=1 Tax=bioreactor metagenome TaxID=1076179 RepID=A0A644Y9T2_9ZZZZ